MMACGLCRELDQVLAKDGLLHISRLSASGRVDSVADVVSQDDIVWVKAMELCKNNSSSQANRVAAGC
eukprot:g25931.t1